MKGILVIIDGLSDLPHKLLKGKTPLESAEKPNLNYLASVGKLGYLFPITEDTTIGTSEAIVSMFGEEWQEYPRGFLEALGAGIDVKRGDLCLRCNFATIENLKSKKVLDRRAGRNLTTKEASVLAKELNEKIKLPCKFIFKNTLQHRAVLVFKGGYSDNITDTDPAYHHAFWQDKLKFSLAEDDEEATQYSANILNNFIEQSFHILQEHPVNAERKRKGFYPANIIITRAAGTSVKIGKTFKKWACSASVPVMKGICKALKINLFDFPAIEFKSHDAYEDLKKNLTLEIEKSINLIKKREKEFDYFLIYLKETDSAGHDNKPIEKKEMIELIDKKLFSFLRKFADKKIKIAVTADHSTPCILKRHSSEPVPVLFFTGEKKKKNQNFSEKSAKQGELGKLYGNDFLSKIGFEN